VDNIPARSSGVLAASESPMELPAVPWGPGQHHGQLSTQPEDTFWDRESEGNVFTGTF